jgi:hypothetical protein
MRSWPVATCFRWDMNDKTSQQRRQETMSTLLGRKLHRVRSTPYLTAYGGRTESCPYAVRKLKLGQLRGEIGHPPCRVFHRSDRSRSSTWLGSPFWPSVDCVKALKRSSPQGMHNERHRTRPGRAYRHTWHTSWTGRPLGFGRSPLAGKANISPCPWHN